jgi:hypothetical protein
VSDRELVRKDHKSLSASLGKTAGIKKELKRATEPDQLQRRRVELEGCRIRAEKVVSHFNDPKLPPDKRQDLYLQAQAISSLGILKGICLLTDMLSWADKGDVDGRDMLRRTSYMEIIWDRLIEIQQATTIQFTDQERELYARNLPEGADIPEGLGAVQALIAMDQKLTGLYEMMHKLGLHANPEIFKVTDKNGVVLTEDQFAETPGTFFEGADDDSDESIQADDPEAITQEDADKIRKDAEDADDLGEDKDDGDEDNDKDE